jgi:predicted phosphodiesterase
MILVVGDIHGEFEELKQSLIKKMITDCYVIQVGDFGIGFNLINSDLRRLIDLNSFLEERNIIMYVIRGNHDNPDFFKGNIKYSNLILMEDYTVLELDDRKILCIGGAISIDRTKRKNDQRINRKSGDKRRLYWIDEHIFFDESKIKNLKDINIMITHTAPDWCEPDNKINFGDLVDQFAVYDPTLKHELREERKLLSNIYDIVSENSNIEKLYYGHFHRSCITEYGITTAYLLDIHEIREVR